jgi:TRAP-type C4-dicarboxylate transport system substrate-binding protein
MLRKTLIALAGVAVLAASGSAIAQQKLVLGTVQGPPTGFGISLLDHFIPRVEKYSNGAAVVEFDGPSAICVEHQCVEQMQQDLIQISTSSTENIGAFGRTYDVINLPYFFRDLEWADMILNGWLADWLDKTSRKDMNVGALAVVPCGGFRQLANNVRRVKAPADLKGIKIRVTKSPVEFTLIKAWGGIPIPYDWVQLYQGLQTGVVNGQYVQLPWQDLYKMYEVQQHYTVMGGAWGGNVIYMHEKRVQKLPGWAKDALQKAMDDFVVAALANDAAWVKEGTARIKAKVETFYSPNAAEQAKWLAGAVQAWKGAKGTYDASIAKKALKEQGLMEFLAKLEKAGAL